MGNTRYRILWKTLFAYGAGYADASAQTVAATVTTPIEQTINGVQGMAYMSSVSANDDSTTITVTFDVGYDVDIAAVDVGIACPKRLGSYRRLSSRVA